MEFNEVITFEGGINTDDNPQAVPKGDYRDFAYCRIGYNAGNALAVTTSDGTLEIANEDIGTQDRILGAAPWQKENAIIYFVYKTDLSHQIWMYDITSQTHIKVLESPVLNFDPNWPIYHANIIDDICKWTDGRWDPLMYEADGTRLFNPPYQINLRKALDGYYTTVSLQTIDAIKWPLDPPVVNYFTDPTRNDNKLRNKLFKFIVQPIYENDEYGVWSMYSNLSLPVQSELISGTNWVYLNNDNGIRISFKTGPKTIRKFNLAVQQFNKDNFGTEPPFAVFLQLDKDQDGIADNITHTVDFYGGVATSPAFDVFKNYDRLPVVADCQEFLPTNQLTYVNFREGYDKPTDEPFILDVEMQYQLQEINWEPQPLSLHIQIDGIIGYDRIGFGTTPFGAGYGTDTTGNVYSFSIKFSSPIVTTVNFQIIGGSYDDVQNQIVNQINDYFNAIIAAPSPSSNQLIISTGSGFIVLQADFFAAPSRQTLSRPSLKSGATHEFGIVYGDRAYRDGTVYTNDSMNVFVPWFNEIDRSGLSDPINPFLINPAITIRHIPPIWADRYWIVAKPATEILSFGQYITNRDDTATLGGGYISSITIDDATNNRYKIRIDNYYENKNIGAKIRHEIKIGDKLRFIRRNAINLDYLPYLELDIIDFDPVGGEEGRPIVYTNLFDISLIEPDITSSAGQVFGQQIEIYTPRPSVDDTGNVFVSTWNDITIALPIQNPHTENRSHKVPPLYLNNFQQFVGVTYAATPFPDVIIGGGDFSNLVGNTYVIQIQPSSGPTYTITGTVTAAKYDVSTNTTYLTIPGVPTSQLAFVTFLSEGGPYSTQDQIVTGLVSTQAAQFAIPYGDVYMRQRDFKTGLDTPKDVYFYFCEDPNYSDYWASSIHNTGRIRIEDQNARMTHRQATAIHSDSFIVGTQINGLSSFGLDNQNIKDMNPTFGPVIKAMMSGREGKTLKCLQQRKENSIYIQYYPNEVGSDSTVRVSNATFASWFDYKSLFGCTNPGATALLPNGAAMYFDNRAGVFIYSGANGQIVVSEIDQDNGKDYKFRTKTKALAAAYNSSASPLVRTYVNESVGEVGFAFCFDDPFNAEDATYDHVVFDYVNMRWRSTYDYNFQQFCNLGQTLVGWGVNNQLYLHNQLNQWTFHGDPFTQKVSFVSNEQPLMLKRYQDISLVSDDLFSISAQSEPNRSYPLGMKTTMPTNLISTYEGYGKVNYRKNLYDPRFFNNGGTSTSAYDPPTQPVNGWIFNLDQTALVGQNVTIIQSNSEIFTGVVATAVLVSGNTLITLTGFEPNSNGIAGNWYYSEIAMLNGEDIRANALTHTLEYDPTINNTGSVLVSVGIKGVLS